MARTEAPPPAVPLERRDVSMAAVVAGFHRAVAERLLGGARDRLRACGLPEDGLDVVWVPGAFEIPLAARLLADSGRYVAVLALGAVIRGETPHFGYVCDATASGLQRVALDTGVPCAFGLLTCDTPAQADARSGGAVGNKGEEAADAAVAMANLVARAGRRVPAA